MIAEQQKRDYWLLTLLSAAVSIAALGFYFKHNQLLLYGDAVAHINIGRRVFDSRTPGIFQLGTVWLPLPHLLEIPFIVNDWMWRTGAGAAIPSMLAYIAGALGIFRLVGGGASRASAWIASLIYLLNPNLIYLQSTAMTESLYLALFVWVIVHFAEFVRFLKIDPGKARKSLEKCSLALAGAMLVRYDAWFLAAVLLPAAFIAVANKRVHVSRLYPNDRMILQLAAAKGIFINMGTKTASSVYIRKLRNLLLLPGVVASLWLAYNYAVYQNPLEFANGPYSARAIEHRTRSATMASYPGENAPRDATLYFLKAARLNVGQGSTDYFLPIAAFVSLVAMLYFSRRHWPWFLLWAPVPFYAASIAWASVPLYFPDWYPFSYYNVRYGLQLLPAFAIFTALGCEFLRNCFRLRWIVIPVSLLIFLSYFSEWRSTPICLREARANGAARMKFEQQLGVELKKLPESATLLMDCGAHSGAVQAAGIHFSRIVRETNFREWVKALSQPAQSADYLIAFTGDDVWSVARRNSKELELVGRIGNSRNYQALLYRSLRR